MTQSRVHEAPENLKSDRGPSNHFSSLRLWRNGAVSWRQVPGCASCSFANCKSQVFTASTSQADFTSKAIFLLLDQKAKWRRDSGASIRPSCSVRMSSQLRGASLAHAVVALLPIAGPGIFCKKIIARKGRYENECNNFGDTLSLSTVSLSTGSASGTST